MHLPDGYLDTGTALLSAGAAAVAVGAAFRQVRAELAPRQMPLLGLAGAFIFAAQMLNFPIPGGTSGHVMGGPLAALLLGPGPAVIVMTCVLVIQALMFSDGGLTALGANVFNIGVVSVAGGYLSFRLVRRLFPLRGERGFVFGAAVAGWSGTVLAAMTCAGQLALSGTAPWNTTFLAMTSAHALIGLGEGIVTALVALAVLRSRPGLMSANEASAGGRGLLGFGLLLSLGLAVFVAPFASPWPDGLEKVAKTLGFEHAARPPALPALMPDYALPFIGSPKAATALAGFVGTLVVFLLAYLLACWLVPRSGKPENHGSPAA